MLYDNDANENLVLRMEWLRNFCFVCVCERERERERENQSHKQSAVGHCNVGYVYSWESEWEREGGS
jgi:hypothetical protein